MLRCFQRKIAPISVCRDDYSRNRKIVSTLCVIRLQKHTSTVRNNFNLETSRDDKSNLNARRTRLAGNEAIFPDLVPESGKVSEARRSEEGLHGRTPAVNFTTSSPGTTSSQNRH